MKNEFFLSRAVNSPILLIICTFFLFMPSLFAHFSLFFTESEVHLIRQNLLPENESTKTTSNPEKLHLSAIVYVDAGHWALWLNKRMVRSDDLHQINGFRIEKVTPLKVKFSRITTASAILKTFTLFPNPVIYRNENRSMSQQP